MYLAYLAEKNSEHPLAKAIVKKIHSLIPSKIDEMSLRYSLIEFKNKNGEGIVAKINDQQENKIMEVLCGNNRLLTSMKVDLDVSI